MGRKIIVSALAGTLALAATGLAPGVGASAADAQEPQTEAREHRMRGGDPIQRLLDRRSDLELTATQVAQLEQVRTELRAKNQPLHEQMRAARQDGARASGDRAAMREMNPEQRRAAMEQRRERRQQMTEEQREAMRARREAHMAAVRPIMEQARANSRAAMEQVNSVLTEEQRAKVRASREARSQQRRERGQDPARQRHGGHQQGHGR